MSAVETAFQGLRQMMATGQLQAGQRFPIESELCAELGVSRSSLREAVRMLAALGVVEVRQGSGTYVSQLRAADIVRSLTLTVGLLPLDGLLEIYELRRVLEGYAASQAAARRPEELVGRMDALLVEIEACTDPDRTGELDAANGFLETILTSLRAGVVVLGVGGYAGWYVWQQQQHEQEAQAQTTAVQLQGLQATLDALRAAGYLKVALVGLEQGAR